jgi:arabinoxylan arabinofuranohydrolase
MARKIRVTDKANDFRKPLILVYCLVAGLFNAGMAQTVTYPHNFTYTGNPLSRTTGASDPSVHVWDGKVWMYTSKDHNPNYSAMDGYNVFSSSDLIHWTDYGEIFNSSKLKASSWGNTQKGWMWAPGAARKKNANDEWTYYLYYPHNAAAAGAGENWVTGVASAPNPWGPFTDQGMLGGYPQLKAGMDPMVFIDDDGQAYIYANSAKVSKLNPDMISIAEAPKDIEYALDRTDVKNNNGRKFGEGSYMHKRNGDYYYSYSNFEGENDMQGFYATGTNPYGPFTWKGAMAPHPRGAQDHHSIIEFKGQWLYFYHIAVSNYPSVRDGQSRIACYDYLYYNTDGTIKPVIETLGTLRSYSQEIKPSRYNSLSAQQINLFQFETTPLFQFSGPSNTKATIHNALGKELKRSLNPIPKP